MGKTTIPITSDFLNDKAKTSACIWPSTRWSLCCVDSCTSHNKTLAVWATLKCSSWLDRIGNPCYTWKLKLASLTHNRGYWRSWKVRVCLPHTGFLVSPALLSLYCLEQLGTVILQDVDSQERQNQHPFPPENPSRGEHLTDSLSQCTTSLHHWRKVMEVFYVTGDFRSAMLTEDWWHSAIPRSYHFWHCLCPFHGGTLRGWENRLLMT